MSNKHWIKLWLSVLDDPILGAQPDDLWRLAIELFLVAGEYGDDGIIPNGKALAWRLRREHKSLTPLLRKLEALQIVVREDDDTLKVRAFAKRQSRVPDKIRKRAERKTDIKGWLHDDKTD